MNFLKRLDLNIDPFLAHSWMTLAWLESFGVTQEEVLP